MGRKFISLPHDGPGTTAFEGKRKLKTEIVGVSLFPIVILDYGLACSLLDGSKSRGNLLGISG